MPFHARRAAGTALDDYMAAPDPNYAYSVVRTIPGFGYTAYVVDLTSQAWRSPAEVDRPVWRHWLSIVIPTTTTRDLAMLVIDGGDNGGGPPTSVDDFAVYIAVTTQTVVAHLPQVPNQPLRFAGESVSRREDEIIAYTFDKYLTTGDGTWPALLPMVKSAVRAMDAVQAVVPAKTGGRVHINKFAVGGASKRGWTTWLTGAVDARCVALAPLVIDMLNLDESMDHHWAAYGFFAPAVHDYQEMDIFSRMYTPQGQALLAMVDPYEYRERYASLPVYGINSTGDQFFVSDSAQFYFDDLEGEKYLRYMPNTDHGLEATEAASNLLAFYQSVVNGAPRPRFSWTIEADRSIVVRTIDAPSEVRLWQATATGARDFRLETLGAAWRSSILASQGGGVYIARVPEPPVGWTGFFVELTFPSGSSVPYKFTTNVRVVPPTLPFAPDLDHDRDVDADDLADFQACMTGANRGPPDGHCVVADLDVDGDVDQTDFGWFQRCLSGPNQSMDPDCMK